VRWCVALPKNELILFCAESTQLQSTGEARAKGAAQVAGVSPSRSWTSFTWFGRGFILLTGSLD